MPPIKASTMSTIKRMWSGGSAASEIGIVVSMSRSAVLGAVHRGRANEGENEWPARPVVRKHPREYAQARRERVKKKKMSTPRVIAPKRPTHAKKPRKAMAPTEPVAAPNMLNISILEIGFGQCRYPLWAYGTIPQPEEALHCGVKTKPGLVYCDYHNQKCWSPHDKSEASKTKPFPR